MNTEQKENEFTTKRRISSWFIDEPGVLLALVHEGYGVLQGGGYWYETDAPIEPNRMLALSDGQVLHSYGTHLSLLTEQEIEQKKVEEFDRRLREAKER